MSNFPDWFTVDDDGMYVLVKYLKAEFGGETVKIVVEEEENEKT